MNKNIIDERISSISKMRKEIKRLESALLGAESKEAEKKIRQTLIDKNISMRNIVSRLEASIEVSIEASEYIQSMSL